jgi:hypothetical protein
LFRPTKGAFSIFRVPKSGFCEAATESANGKLGTTSHINNRPPGIHISTLVSLRKSSDLSFEFCASSCRFHGKRPPNRAYLIQKNSKNARLLRGVIKCELFARENSDVCVRIGFLVAIV